MARSFEQAKSGMIQAFKEKSGESESDVEQPKETLGSVSMFRKLQQLMREGSDVLVYIHGFNVDWNEAVGSALALQEMCNLSISKGNDSQKQEKQEKQKTTVVLFSWPSNGKALPFMSYASDRSDARGSSCAFGRGILKLCDYLKEPSNGHCNACLHLLCHSMGNYVLQNALERITEYVPSGRLPRLFEHVYLCSPDVDEDVLERDEPLGKLHEITRNVSVYFNTEDVPLHVSDKTKFQPDRLGTSGASRPAMLHSKIHQVDCSDIVEGLIEHSYYLDGNVNRDIRLSLAEHKQDSNERDRERDPKARNTWILTAEKRK